MFRERKKCSWLQHPIGFREKFRTVDHVHSDVLAVRPIEHTVCIGQVVAIALDNGDALIHARQSGEFVGCLDKWLSDIDAAHPALKVLRKVTRGPPPDHNRYREYGSWL